MLLKDLITTIESNLINSPALPWDNVGLLVGDEKAPITKCLLSLDFTKDSLNKAIEIGAELVINHHPVIFDPIKKISADDLFYSAIKNNINIYTAHTNLDACTEGINDVLCDLLELNVTDNVLIENLPLCRLCKLKSPMSSIELAKHVKSKLGIEFVTYTDCHKEKSIETVAVLCGGGNAGVTIASSIADAYITGELKHENTVALYNNGTTLVQAGHFFTESVILAPFAERLKKLFPNIDFIVHNPSVNNLCI